MAFLAFMVQWPPHYPANLGTRWIGFAEESWHTAIFRKEFFLDGLVRSAWVKIAADNSYNLYVNGNLVGSNGNYGSAQAFQDKSSEPEQKIGSEAIFRAHILEVHLEGNAEWLFASMHDFRDKLRQGRNVLAVEVMSSRTTPRLALEGKVINEAGVTVDLVSDPTWRIRHLPEMRNGLHWRNPEFVDVDWRPVDVVAAPGSTFTTFDPAIYMQPFQGNAIALGESSAPDLFYRSRFRVDEPVQDAWIRVVNVASYDIFLNGIRLTSRIPVVDKPGTLELELYSIRPLIRQGENVLAVHVGPLFNQRFEAQVPVLLLDGLIRYESGRGIPLVSDGSWRVSARVERGWISLGYDDRSWSMAQHAGVLPRETVGNLVHRYRGQPYSWGLKYYVWAGVAVILGFVVCSLGAYLGAAPFARLVGVEARKGPGLLALCLVGPTTLFVLVLLLRIQFGESDAKVPFYTPGFWRLILLGGLLVLATNAGVIAIGSRRRSPAPSSDALSDPGPEPTQGFWIRRGELICLLAILVLAFVLRIWGLGFQAYHGDEAASVVAAQGIAATGKPAYPSGVWYTRSALYHYFLGGMQWLFGESRFFNRLSAAVFAVPTVWVLYEMGKALFGSRRIALLGALVLSIDPAGLLYSRVVRYYQPLQFFATLTLYLLLRGIILRWDRRLQIFAVISFILAMLTAEVITTFFPALVLGYLIFAPPFQWRNQKHFLIGLVMIGSVLFLDLMVYQVRTLTPFIGITESARTMVTPHLLNLQAFPLALFVGHHRIHIIHSIFFFMGLPLWLRRRNGPVLYLYLVIFLTLGVESLLLFDKSMRYTFFLNPVFFLLAVASAVEIATRLPLGRWKAGLGGQLGRAAKQVGAVTTLLLAVGLVLAVHPVRLLGAYNARIIPDLSGASEFVKWHKRPGDVVISVNPLPSLIAVNEVDYVLTLDPVFHYYFRREGLAADRSTGKEIVKNADKVRRIFDENERVWIIVDRVRWPAGRSHAIMAFIIDNTEVVYDGYFGRVLLWDWGRGRFSPSPGLGGERNLF